MSRRQMWAHFSRYQKLKAGQTIPTIERNSLGINPKRKVDLSDIRKCNKSDYTLAYVFLHFLSKMFYPTVIVSDTEIVK